MPPRQLRQHMRPALFLCRLITSARRQARRTKHPDLETERQAKLSSPSAICEINGVALGLHHFSSEFGAEHSMIRNSISF